MNKKTVLKFETFKPVLAANNQKCLKEEMKLIKIQNQMKEEMKLLLLKVV